MSLVIDRCCPESAGVIGALTLRRWQEEQLPLPLQVELFRWVCWLCICFQLLLLLPDLNYWKWNFPCLVSQAALFGKTKWFSCFGVWVRKNMWCFARTEKPCWPAAPCPISSVALCCFVLFSLIALHAGGHLHVNHVAVWTVLQSDSGSKARPHVWKLSWGRDRDRRSWTRVSNGWTWRWVRKYRTGGDVGWEPKPERAEWMEQDRDW